MILDKQTMFSEAQTLVASAGSFASTNVIDLGIARNVGGDTHPTLELFAQIVSTYLASGGASTLKVDVQTAPDDGSGGIGSWVTLASSDAIAKASLVAGYKFAISGFLPTPTQRFLRLQYTIATSDGTAGAITAGLTPSGEYRAAYARGYTA